MPSAWSIREDGELFIRVKLSAHHVSSSSVLFVIHDQAEPRGRAEVPNQASQSNGFALI